MDTPDHINELPVVLKLPDKAIAFLDHQAATSGHQVAEVAAEFIERLASTPSLEEIVAPVHQQVAQSGMSDQEIEDFLRQERDAYRREKQAKSS